MSLPLLQFGIPDFEVVDKYPILALASLKRDLMALDGGTLDL
jgi:hypothetical protein